MSRVAQLVARAARTGTLATLSFFAIVMGSGGLFATGHWAAALLLLSGLLFLPPPPKG